MQVLERDKTALLEVTRMQARHWPVPALARHGAHACASLRWQVSHSAWLPGPDGPHLHRDRAHPCHICTGTGLTPATSAPGPGSPLPHLRRDWGRSLSMQVDLGERSVPFDPRKCALPGSSPFRQLQIPGVLHFTTPPSRHPHLASSSARYYSRVCCCTWRYTRRAGLHREGLHSGSHCWGVGSGYDGLPGFPT
jgi:hypothetical protein